MNSDNPFELFGLPETFRIDPARLATARNDLQSRHHPDRHAGGDDAARRKAAAASASINDAWETLRDDRRRAAWLLERRGSPLEGEGSTIHDPVILMEQMELHERLAAAGGGGDAIDEVERIGDEVCALRRKSVEAIAAAFEGDDLETARSQTLRLRFYDRLLEEVDRLLDEG